MTRNDLILYGGILAIALVVVLYLIYWKKEKKELSLPQNPAAANSLNLKLQAYERLVLLAERIALPSLVTRIPPGDLDIRQMQAVLIDQIKNEFEYNLSQQIYVSPQAWHAVTNLKEQNIFIINQASQTLPPDAKGIDLSKRIIELINADPKVSLHPVVLEALNFEAKKLL
jgi:hypothetical protein